MSLRGMLFAGLTALVLAGSARADLGIGATIGEPTGLSLKFDERLVFGASWSFSAERVYAHGDYWFLNPPISDPFFWYLGAGLAVSAGTGDGNGDLGIAARVPVGIQWVLNPTWEFFAEVVPSLAVLPDVDFDPKGAIGFRFHF